MGHVPVRKLNYNGDTIVEVLIAVAVIGSVLGITYGTMNRNMMILRDNQERTEAVKLAQGQVESLKAGWKNITTQNAIIAKGDDGYCMASLNPVDITGGSPTPSSPDNLSNYPADCTQDFYHYGIKRLSPTDEFTYRVYVRYDNINGTQSEVMLVYKVADPTP